MYKLLLILVLHTFLFSQCSSDANDQLSLLKKFESSESNNISFDGLIESISLVNLETNKSSFIVNVDKILIHKGVNYILDRKQDRIFKFSDSGKYIGLVGKKGDAPGEYVSAFDFDNFENGDVIIASNADFGAYFYNADGDFLMEYRLATAPVYVAVLDQNSFAVHVGLHEPDNRNVICIDKESKRITAKYSPFPSSISAVHYEYTGSLKRCQDDVYYTDYSSSYIFDVKSQSVNHYYDASLYKDSWPYARRFEFEMFDNLIQQGGYISFLTADYEIGAKHAILRHVVNQSVKSVYCFDDDFTFKCYHQSSFSESLLLKIVNYGDLVGIVNDHFIFHLDPSIKDIITKSDMDIPMDYKKIIGDLEKLNAESNGSILLVQFN